MLETHKMVNSTLSKLCWKCCTIYWCRIVWQFSVNAPHVIFILVKLNKTSLKPWNRQVNHIYTGDELYLYWWMPILGHTPLSEKLNTKETIYFCQLTVSSFSTHHFLIFPPNLAWHGDESLMINNKILQDSLHLLWVVIHFLTPTNKLRQP